MGVASLAHAQVQSRALVAADTDEFGTKATDTAISVGANSIVVTSNHGISMLNKAGTVLVSHKFTDPGFPFKRFGTGSGSVAPSRWFDARTDYQPSTGRQWISFSEQNAEFGSTGTNTISPLHLAVTKSPDVFPPGGLSNFGTGQWWYFTGNAGNPGNGGTAFNMQDTAMLRYPGGGPDNPFPDAPMVTPQRSPLFDLPIISIDEQAVYVTAFGTDADLISTNPDVYGPSYIFCGIYIIPVEFDDGTGPKSMLDGDQPGMGLVTSRPGRGPAAVRA
jgi:hypothetical protein